MATRDIFDDLHEEHVKNKNPQHPSGKVTGFEEKSGLPIVKLDHAPSEGAEKPAVHETRTPENSEQRDVLHASTDREHLVQEAKEKAPELESHLKAVTAAVPGAKVDAVRDEKDPKRLDEKIGKEGQPVDTIPDVLAGRVKVDSPEAHKEVVGAIKKTAPVVREENDFKKGDSKFGFRAHKLQVGVSPDMTAEVQVLPKEQAENESHGDYKKGREAELSGDKETADAEASKAKAKNDVAMSKFNERNRTKTDDKGVGARGSVDSGTSVRKPSGKEDGDGAKPNHSVPQVAGGALKVGDSVTLPNGKAAVVAYVPAKSSQLPTYRFKLDGGGTTELRANQVDGKITSKSQENTAAPDNAKGTINVDLDATLAHSRAGGGSTYIGSPEPAMVDRIKKDLAAGKDVKIFTARVSNDPDGRVRKAIQEWSKKYIGVALDVTDKKTEATGEILDDKAKHVEPNTGKVTG